MKRICKRLVELAAEAVFPSNIYCICCGSLIDGTRPYALCDSCMKKLHWIVGRTCETCGKALPDTYRGRRCYDCMMQRRFFTAGYSCLTYGLHEREILMDLKYNGKGYLAAKLGDILYDRMMCEDVSPDVIVPVPVSRKREKQRGYNQAALMADRLARRWEIPSDFRLLCRTRETKPLRSLNPAEREAALMGAFAVRENAAARLAGRTVLLVDDIFTTGATANACSKVLLEAGAGDVYLLTLASGGNRRPEAAR